MAKFLRLIVSQASESDSPSNWFSDFTNALNGTFGKEYTSLFIGLLLGAVGMYFVCKLISKDKAYVIDNYRKREELLFNQINIKDERIHKMHNEKYDKNTGIGRSDDER